MIVLEDCDSMWCPRQSGNYGDDAFFGIYEMDPPTYSPWVRHQKLRKQMILKEINGGPGRTRTFDLPIMRKLLIGSHRIKFFTAAGEVAITPHDD